MNSNSSALNILLADDDRDECFFFNLALKGLPFKTNFTTVNGGVELLNNLENSKKLPDVVFLDINMTDKNGFDCLMEMKQNEKTQHIPVIIYSTSLDKDHSDMLYNIGAHYYIYKTDMVELQKMLLYAFLLMDGNKFARPHRNNFILINHKKIAS